MEVSVSITQTVIQEAVIVVNANEVLKYARITAMGMVVVTSLTRMI
jgi:hypothetical protein